jgi:Cu(I)/Ag(I) efflux system periplasmic protein CusF
MSNELKGNPIMKRILLTVLFGLLSVQPLLADDKHHPDALTDGEIRKVDKDAKKITIKHGEIKNLEMPPMTMVFQVKDPVLLEQVKAGDKVRFAADKVGGGYVVTRIESTK